MAIVVCRARLGHDCNHGRPVDSVYTKEMGPIQSDGTWDGRTVICTPCYVRLMPYTPDGMGMLKDLQHAIKLYRDAHRKMEDRVEAFVNANKDDYTVSQEKLADGSVKLILLNEKGEEEGGAILPPGRPILWL